MSLIRSTIQLLFCTLLSAAATAQDLSSAVEIRQHQVHELMAARNFAALEDLAERYRRIEKRSPEGFPTLAVYYSAFMNAETCATTDVPGGLSAFWQDWQAAAPDSLAQQVLRAKLLNREAWNSHDRGMGGGRPELWELWRVRSREVWELLEPLLELEHADGEVCAELLHAAQGLQPERDRLYQILDRCLNIDAGYFPFHFRTMIYLYPLWGGARGEAEEYAARVAFRRRRIDGDELYAELAYTMLKRYQGGCSERVKYDAARVAKGFQEMQQRYPQNKYNGHRAAYALIRLNAYHLAQVALEQAGNSWDQETEQIWSSPEAWQQAREQVAQALKE